MSQSAIGVGLIGCGTIGGGVAQLFKEMPDLYFRRLGRRIELRKVLDLDFERAMSCGAVSESQLTNDPDDFFNTDMSIVVELAGGKGVISRFVRRGLETGRHVVTANKSLLASEGPELFSLARRNGVSIAFEASCGGGIPCITALQFGLMANEIQGLYGILNGTCNYILTEMSRGDKPYDIALGEAKEKGFAEADPTLDVSGVDTAQKLAILSSLAFGIRLMGDQVGSIGIDRLDLRDIRFGAELGYDIKLLGIAERKAGGVSVGVEPCFIHRDELLARVHGAFNALSVYGHAVGHTMYYGAGAGRRPTAGAVMSDVLNIASGWYPKAFTQMNLTPDLQEPADLISPEDLASRYYLRINTRDLPGVLANVASILGGRQIGISAVMQHESGGEFVPVVITTHIARRGDLDAAVGQIEQLDVVDGRPVVVRIVDFS